MLLLTFLSLSLLMSFSSLFLSFLLSVLLLLCAPCYLSPMCVIPSPVSPSNNSVQISVRHQVPKPSIYQDKHKINTHPTQTQHTGSLADLPMTLAPAAATEFSDYWTERVEKKYSLVASDLLSTAVLLKTENTSLLLRGHIRKKYSIPHIYTTPHFPLRY